MLARMASLHPGSFRNFLERRWRKIAPKKAVKERDAAGRPALSQRPSAPQARRLNAEVAEETRSSQEAQTPRSSVVLLCVSRHRAHTAGVRCRPWRPCGDVAPARAIRLTGDMRSAQNSSLIIALNCSSTSLACSSGVRSASSSFGGRRRDGVGDHQAGDDGAALGQHQFLALGQRGQGLGDARGQVVEVDLLQAARAFSRSRISVSSASVGDRRGRRGRRLGLLAAHGVDQLDHQEDHEGDDQELDDGVEEGAVADRDLGLLGAGRPPAARSSAAAKSTPAGDQARSAA